MHAPINQEALQEKWAPLLDADGQDPIKDAHRRMVTAVLLENQEQTLKEEREFLSESPTNAAGTGGFGGGATGSPAFGGASSTGSPQQYSGSSFTQRRG